MVKEFNILVTGSNGQLGKSIKSMSKEFPNYNFYFQSKEQLDISSYAKVFEFVDLHEINLIINCAAYTDVNKAETDLYLADLINNVSVGYIAEICEKKNIQLIHISTDYVFDGKNSVPYTENDTTNPINYYGISKRNGEKEIMKFNLNNSIILRTSWLYSENKNNFVNRVLNKIYNDEDFSVPDDEFGSPTCSHDLAKVILNIISKIDNSQTEIFHYSNSGFCSRFNFANEIKLIVKGKSKITKSSNEIQTILRPKYSVLNCDKIIQSFNLKIDSWNYSLDKHLKKNKINFNNEV